MSNNDWENDNVGHLFNTRNAVIVIDFSRTAKVTSDSKVKGQRRYCQLYNKMTTSNHDIVIKINDEGKKLTLDYLSVFHAIKLFHLNVSQNFVMLIK